MKLFEVNKTELYAALDDLILPSNPVQSVKSPLLGQKKTSKPSALENAYERAKLFYGNGDTPVSALFFLKYKAGAKNSILDELKGHKSTYKAIRNTLNSLSTDLGEKIHCKLKSEVEEEKTALKNARAERTSRHSQPFRMFVFAPPMLVTTVPFMPVTAFKQQ